MATIVTRSGKGSPLTNNEVDANFTNLNTDKLESGDTAASLTITSADINGGTIDGATIATSDVTVGAGKTLDVSAGTLTLANDQISGDKIEGGTIGSVTITTADINGGTLDGVTIGGSSAGAITGTTGQFNTSLNVDGTVTADGLTVDGTATLQGSSGSTLNIKSTNGSVTTGDLLGQVLFVGSDGSTPGGGTKAKIRAEVVSAVGDDSQLIFSTSDGATNDIDRMLIANNGDISFYDDSGNAKFFWDASAESLGIGTSSPSYPLEISSSSNVIAKFSTSSSGFAPGSILLESTDNAGRGEGIYLYNTVGDDAWYSGVPYNVAGDKFIIAHESQAAFDANVADVSHALMTVQSNGNVGIGTSSPAADLHVGSNGYVKIDGVESASPGVLSLGYVSDFSQIYVTNFGGELVLSADASNSKSGSYMQFRVDDTERMRIDSSGNLLVGKTSSSLATDGIEAKANGSLFVTRSSATPVSFRRSTTDGDIVAFYKDGSTVGSIGSKNGDLDIGTGNTAIRFNNGLGSIFPVTAVSGGGNDAAVDIGYSTIRFKDLYLSGGVYLGGTGSANQLDDYEEGTWTPEYEPETGAFSSISYQNQGGFYTKIGNRVFFQGRLRTSSLSVGTASGKVYVSGLPFTPNNDGDAGRNAGAISVVNGWAGENPYGFDVEVIGSYFRLYYRTSADGEYNHSDVSDLATGGSSNQIFFSGSYTV